MNLPKNIFFQSKHKNFQRIKNVSGICFRQVKVKIYSIKLQIRSLLKFSLFSFFFFCLNFFFKIAKNKTEIDSIVIPFLRPSGIGDFLMTSPIIIYLASKFKHLPIYIITELPELIAFPSNVKLCDKIPSKEKTGNSLLISTHPSFRSLSFILKTKNWIGYFFQPILQGNLDKIASYKYSPQRDHYLKKGIGIVKNFSDSDSLIFEENMANFNVSYPNLIEDLSIFSKAPNLEKGKYLVIGVIPQFDHSLYPIERIIYILNKTLTLNKVEQLVFTGDRSERNQSINLQIIEKLIFPADKIINLTGKTNLKQITALLKYSKGYFGIDSGIAHLAYFCAPQSLILFIIANPSNILPLNQKNRDKIKCISPYEIPNEQLFDGMTPVNKFKAKKYAENLDMDDICQELINLVK